MTFARLRIWAAMLLILGLFGAPPGSTAEAYQESPWLRDDVSAGRLPPVGERLPTDPLVVDLKAQGKQIGKPGGTLRMMIGQGSDARSLLPFAYSRLIIYDENYRLAPDILASFDVQEVIGIGHCGAHDFRARIVYQNRVGIHRGSSRTGCDLVRIMKEEISNP